MNSKDKANQFLTEEQAFRLGPLLTESSHPKTQTLSQTIQQDTEAGIRLFQSVDQDLVEKLDMLFSQDGYVTLVDALLNALSQGRRIFFTGCGATGRLSILLEAAWRRFWQGIPGHPQARQMEQSCISVMAGGDFALIKSVEGFEDFPDFGRYQLREAGVQAGDVVVAITEGGETPFVIGTAWEGLDTGAHVFFVYNNPTDLLCQHVERSREVLEDPRITKLDLATGPMAIAGSTRMQATTAELLVVGSALEQALLAWWQPDEPYPDPRHIFRFLMQQITSPSCVTTLAQLTEFEESIYRQHGLITYTSNWAMLDVLTDTTERSPTFMIPPFRPQGDTQSPLSWAFVKNPLVPTEQAWDQMLKRAPRGLTWTEAVYQHLKAPAFMQTKPPRLDNQALYGFRIGHENDLARSSTPVNAHMAIGFTDEMHDLTPLAGQAYQQTAMLSIGDPGALTGTPPKHRFHFPLHLPDSPLQLWRHLAVKLILNTVSTATMCRMERVLGNAMVWVSPSNKKLIDRGCRLITQVTHCTYEQACIRLFQAIEKVDALRTQGEAPPSPVAMAIEDIKGGH
jgi:N-acetylmuramic acid 6-phosphate etherase